MVVDTVTLRMYPAGAQHLPGLVIPGLANAPLARLPPCAARPHPGADRRSRLVLDVARADVLRRRAAHPRQLSDAGPRGLCRDGDGGHHHGRRVPLPAPRDRRPRVRRLELHGPCAGAGRRATPGCASPCWTRAISPAASTNRSMECSDGSTTETPRGGRRAPQISATAYDDAADVVVGAADPLGARGAGRPAGSGRRAGRPRGRRRCTCTCPSSGPRTTRARERHGVTPTRLLHDHGALGPRSSAVHATHLVDDDVGAAGRFCDSRLPVPDDRTRPGRRHRPGTRAA